MSVFKLKPSDRVFITGKTGSGKTYLVKYLLANVSRLVVLDGKGTLTEKNGWSLIPDSRDARYDLRMGKPVRIRAIPPERTDPGAYWQDILSTAYDAGTVTVYIDELYAVVPPGLQASPALWAIYTRGREFNIGCWAATQRPVWVPLVALSEAEHYFLFRLSLEEDRNRLAAFMGEDVRIPIHDEHGFYYSRAEWDSPRYYKKLEV